MSYYLECGCKVYAKGTIRPCEFHDLNQPIVGDPLDIFLSKRPKLEDQRPMRKVKAERNWLRLNNSWHLLVEVDGRVHHKTVIIYDTVSDFSTSLTCSKTIKENDLIEYLKQTERIDLELIGD